MTSLVIISVPSVRNARFLVSSRVYPSICERHDVLIVSPFKGAFEREFGRERVRFFNFDKEELAGGRLWSRAYGASEMLRFLGYYRRHRSEGLRLQESMWVEWVYGRNGDDRRRSLIHRAILRTLGALGWHRKAWKLFDRTLGRMFYATPLARLQQQTKGYDDVVVLHGASFGEQERFLNFAAEHLRFRQILVPYTTDQLSVNGFLMADYETVFAQGPWEAEFARRIQGVPSAALAPIGSIWFRNIEDSRARQQWTNNAEHEPWKKILYVGHSSLFFPRPNEFAAIDALLHAMESGALSASLLIYRPLLDDPQELADITARYAADPRVSVQVPQAACIGLSEHSGPEVATQIDEYVRQLRECAVVVMSQVTTLCLDALLLGKPVVSNITDFTGTLTRRRYSEYMDDDIYGLRRAGLPVVSSLPELVDVVEDYLSGRRDATMFRSQALHDWDYGPGQWIEMLLATLERGGTASAAQPHAGVSCVVDGYTAPRR